jgi:plasmid stabilization system protein ParE
MAFNVEWSGPARHQASEIINAIQNDNPIAADKFSAGLFQRVSRLGQFPRSGAVYKRRRGFEVRQITYRKYRILYRVKHRLNRVEVLLVWHGARQEPKLPRKRG